MVIDGVTIDVPQPGPPNIFYHPKIEFFESSFGYEAYASIHPDTNYFRDWEPPMTIDFNTFTFQSAGSTLGDCIPYCDLESDYFGIILGSGTRTFDYEITTATNGDRTLIITNSEGNIAVHGDFVLSIGEFQQNHFSIFPNPVDNSLQLVLEELPISKILIFSIEGKKVSEIHFLEGKTLDVSFLRSGLYFIEITDYDNRRYVQKFIKK